MNTIQKYLSLVKFSHTIFAMPFALVGYAIGHSHILSQFQWQVLILVILCMVFARNAAMSFNRYIDKEIDFLNPRTKNREIPAKKIKPSNALLFCVINSLLFIVCTFFINKICFFLSPVALAIVLGYSYTKRFTQFSHIILGLGLAVAPVGAYLAVTGSFNITPIILAFAVLTWVSGFDIIYALQDQDFDKQYGLMSIPARFGTRNSLIISAILHVFSASALVLIGFVENMSVFYWFGVAVFVFLLFYQHFIVKPNDLSKINQAFFTTNGIASVIFAVFTISDLLFRFI